MFEVGLANDATVAVRGAARVGRGERIESGHRQPAHGGLPGDGGAHRTQPDDGEVDLLIGHGAAS